MSLDEALNVRMGDPSPAAEPLDDPSPGEQAEGSKNDTQATRLVDLALGVYRLGQSSEGEPFAGALDGGPALLLRGGKVGLRSQLAARYRARFGAVPSSSALTDALTVLEGMAMDSDPEPVFLRIGWTNGQVVIDLGDTAAAVIIDRAGWRVVDRAPVLFRRTALTAVLPTPTPGGSLGELWDLVNVTEEARPLVTAWVVSNLLDVAHPILGLLGLQGSGKTTTARILASLLDPSAAAVRAAPRDLEAWAVAASGSYIVPIDNVSALTTWFSDALCRAATGEGIVRRKLYTDSELSVISFRRPVILTSIDVGAMRGDLGERLLAIDTQPIRGRRTDEDIANTWTQAHGRVLGAVLDLAVKVLAAAPTVTVATLPRMADFGRILAAVDHVTGTRGTDTYAGMGTRVAEEVVEGDHVALAVRHLDAFEGTMTELLDTLNKARGDHRPPKDWPASPRALRGRLNRCIPALDALGVTVEFTVEGKDRNRTVHIRRTVADGSDRTPQELSRTPNPNGGTSAQITPRADGSNRPQPSADELLDLLGGAVVNDEPGEVAPW